MSTTASFKYFSPSKSPFEMSNPFTATIALSFDGEMYIDVSTT